MTTVKPLYFDIASGASREVSPTADDMAFAKLVLAGLAGVALDVTGNSIVNVADPVNPQDVVNLRTAQQLILGIVNSHEAVVLASTNQALTGAATIDGVTLATGQQVLLIGQTDAKQNGLWIVSTSGAWSRPVGTNSYASGSHAAGAYIFIQSGTHYANRGYIASVVAGSDVIDTNAVNFTQFSGTGLDTAGSGLLIGDNTLNLVFDPAGAVIADGVGIKSKVDGTTVGIASNALNVLGVPSLFTVGGTATAASVSASNLNAVTGGSYADVQHKHAVADTAPVTQRPFPGGTATLAGPVTLTSAGYVAADISDATTAQSKVLGVANAAGNAIVYGGLAAGVLSSLSGAAKGAFIYAAAGGGYTLTPPSATKNAVYFLGIAENANDLNVQILRLYVHS